LQSDDHNFSKKLNYKKFAKIINISQYNLASKCYKTPYLLAIDLGPTKQISSKYKETILNVGKGVATNNQLATLLSVISFDFK